jgi:hypothetical protein
MTAKNMKHDAIMPCAEVRGEAELRLMGFQFPPILPVTRTNSFSSDVDVVSAPAIKEEITSGGMWQSGVDLNIGLPFGDEEDAAMDEEDDPHQEDGDEEEEREEWKQQQHMQGGRGGGAGAWRGGAGVDGRFKQDHRRGIWSGGGRHGDGMPVLGPDAGADPDRPRAVCLPCLQQELQQI